LYLFSQENLSNSDTEKYETSQEAEKSNRFTIGGGYAIRLTDGHRGETVSGFNIDMNAQTFFNKHIGGGIDLNYVRSPGYRFMENIIYVGPELALKARSNRFQVVCSGGIGAIIYILSNNNNLYIEDNNKTAFGGNVALSGEGKLSDSIGLGIKLSCTIGGSVKLGDYRERTKLSSFLITAFVSFGN